MKTPWTNLEVPPFKEVVFDSNGVTFKKERMPPIIRGYFDGLQLVPNDANWVLHRNGAIWMSVTPMELESLAPHAFYATGHTVIVGAGLGVLLYNVLKKPDVTRVTLIESDPSVMKLLYAVGFNTWEGFDKLTIFVADVFTLDSFTVDVDFLSADIWEKLGGSEALKDTQRIQRKLKAKQVGFWGQEIEFVHWAADLKLPLPLTKKDFTRFIKDVNLPLYGADQRQYVKLALEAARNVILY